MRQVARAFSPEFERRRPVTDPSRATQSELCFRCLHGMYRAMGATVLAHDLPTSTVSARIDPQPGVPTQLASA
jgi:hypothetical protein